MHNTHEELLTPAELAPILKKSVRTIYNWRAQGTHPLVCEKALTIPGTRGVYWRRSDVDNYLRALQHH